MRGLIAIFCCLFTALLSAGEPNLAGIDPLGDAKRELQAGRADAALAALDEVAKRGAPDAEALHLRGCVYLEQQKFEEALQAFRAAHEIDRSLYAPQLHFGDTLLRQRKWGEARASFEGILRNTNILILSERLRYGVLLSYLGAKDDAGAQAALERIVFPTESPTYYYAQAAWAFARGNSKAGLKWMATAEEIFDEKKTAWFARPLYELGWIKNKPSVVLD